MSSTPKKSLVGLVLSYNPTSPSLFAVPVNRIKILLMSCDQFYESTGQFLASYFIRSSLRVTEPLAHANWQIKITPFPLYDKAFAVKYASELALHISGSLLI